MVEELNWTERHAVHKFVHKFAYKQLAVNIEATYNIHIIGEYYHYRWILLLVNNILCKVGIAWPLQFSNQMDSTEQTRVITIVITDQSYARMIQNWGT